MGSAGTSRPESGERGTGDGSGTPCPCGNIGGPGNGCPNSLQPNGARLDFSGFASLTSDTLALNVSAMPNSFALYFQGTTQTNGGAGSVFGDGKRCSAGAVIRLGTKLNAGGASHYPDSIDPSISLTDQDVAHVIAILHRRIVRYLQRRGRLPREEHVELDEPAPDEPLLALISAASVEGRVALGPTSGQPLTRRGRQRDRRPLSLKGELCCDLACAASSPSTS